MNFDFKNGCKMNLRIITRNHAADRKIRFLTKSISKPFGRAMAMPRAWELMRIGSVNFKRLFNRTERFVLFNIIKTFHMIIWWATDKIQNYTTFKLFLYKFLPIDVHVDSRIINFFYVYRKFILKNFWKFLIPILIHWGSKEEDDWSGVIIGLAPPSL